MDDHKRKNNTELDIDQCTREYTATRKEGSTEGTISVMLLKGKCTVVVYDDEDAEVENPAYNTTITISTSSPIKPLGMYFYTLECTNLGDAL